MIALRYYDAHSHPGVTTEPQRAGPFGDYSWRADGLSQAALTSGLGVRLPGPAIVVQHIAADFAGVDPLRLLHYRVPDIPPVGNHDIMTRGKRTLLAVGLLVAGASGGVTAIDWLSRSPINRPAFDKIRTGMTTEQVQEILRLPPGDYSSGPTYIEQLTDELDEKDEASRLESLVAAGGKMWTSDTSLVVVKFNQDGRGDDMGYMHLARHAEPWFIRLRRWLGL